MYPLANETMICESCDKEIIASEGMEPWISVSEVIAEQESHEAYFCSYSCLKTWADEINSPFYLNILGKRLKDQEWEMEEKLKSSAVDKIEKHKDGETCPLCEKEFTDGDEGVFFKGKPIHSRCFEQHEKQD